MGLMDWIKGKSPAPTLASKGPAPQPAVRTAPAAAMPVRPSPKASLPGAVQEDVQIAGGLDFASAIQAHRHWKSRLALYVSNESNEKLNYRVICRDDQCVLGQWINGRGAEEFGHLPSFGELKVSHGQFHLAAGRIVQLHDQKQTNEAAQLLRQGDYPRHSIKVMGLIGALYTEVIDAETPQR